MWFKNATIIGISPKAAFPIEKLTNFAFTPLLELEARSEGWAPVRDDELMYTQGLHSLLRFTVEKKVLPAAAINLALDAKAAKLEDEQGFAPGKKARKELRERLVDEMLPRAFITRQVVSVWIDRAAHRIVIDSVTQPVIDAIQRLLVKTFDDIGLQDVKWPRSTMLTQWLADEPDGFTNDDQVLLQFPGERGKTVAYAKANLHSSDVQQNLNLGAQVTALAMTFDGRMSFVLTDGMCLRRLRPLDILKEEAKGAKDADRFDSDFFLMTAEMTKLIGAVQEAA